MYLAFARTYLGESTAASNEWQRALEAADTIEKCLMLASYAERGAVSQIAAASYLRALQLSPNNRTAYIGELRAVEACGETAKAAAVAGEIVERWPSDDATRDEQAYLKLLLGVGAGEAEVIERQAETVTIQQPTNWNARATLALARLRAGRNAAALEAFSNTLAAAPVPARAMAIRAAALAANGWKEEAATEAKKVALATLLPEERVLIAPLLDDGLTDVAR
jgi:Tfp pilus assembly protein PilF